MQAYTLIPHASSTSFTGKIQATLKLRGDKLSIWFHLLDPAAQAICPDNVGRCHELWRSSCFELFISEEGREEYWELNLSPSTAWNLYHFESYRRTMSEELRLSVLQPRIYSGAGAFTLHCCLNIANFLTWQRGLQLGLSAVIDDGDNCSYYALEHLSSQPDFHDRRSHLISIL